MRRLDSPPGLRRSAAGFTLVETMVVLVILGVLAAIALPSWGRDRQATAGREFARQVARELQRARVQAISERLPVRAFVFSDRVEVRTGIPGATPGAAPRSPTAADPADRVLTARPGVTVVDATAAARPAPSAQVLSTAAGVELEFNPRGEAQLIGAPALSPAFLFVRNGNVPSTHHEAAYRIDVRSATGHVAVRSAW